MGIRRRSRIRECVLCVMDTCWTTYYQQILIELKSKRTLPCHLREIRDRWEWHVNNAELPIDPLTDNWTNMSHYTHFDKEWGVGEGEGGGGGRGRERGEGERGDRGMAIMQNYLFILSQTTGKTIKSHYTHLDKGGEGGEGRGGEERGRVSKTTCITTVHNTLYYHP